MVKDLEALIAPLIVGIAFIALVVTILRSQNPQRRAAATARERAAEEAEPRIQKG